LDNPKEGYLIIYEDTEPVNSSNEFYKRLYNKVNEKFGGIKKYKNKIESFSKDLLSRIEAISLKDVSVTLGESKISYKVELEKMFNNLGLDDERLIILVDEFAQTVENIIEDINESTAINFLETNREIRLSPTLSKKVQFIYACSIGLENIVSKFNGTKFINDLTPILVSPLTTQEAKFLMKTIITGNNITLDDDAFNYLLKKIEWLIPFYFQIILDECGKVLKGDGSEIITKVVIDLAINNVLKYRLYFDNWFDRLRTAFKGKDFSFVKEVLNIASGNPTITSSEIFNLAVKYKLEDSYNNLLNTLKYDGYINNNDDPKIYRFNSPLLKEWWYRNVAN
ncbi:MAG: hypothetical protein WCS69_07855, partial [Ignavibacteriaceae bacterium]